MASRASDSRLTTVEARSVMGTLARFLAFDSDTSVHQHNAYRLLYGVSIVFFLCLWHRMVFQALPLRAVAAFGLVAAGSLAYGRFLVGATALAKAAHSCLTLEFLGGYLLLNTILFVVYVASPLGVPADIAIVSVGAVASWLASRRRALPANEVPSALPSLLACLLCALAATLWCTDGLKPPVQEGSTTIFKLWGDSFVHARHISAFALASGLGSMSDIRMWGAPPYLYHYANYAIPAAVSAMTADGAYEIFASFMLPVGVLLTGLAAFTFADSLWGRWPALAASFALLLIPDAYQQGFGNKYLSYNFMQQVNVGGLFGVPCMAVAWIFVLYGCRSGNIVAVLAGWVVAVVALPYKAHVFVANAFLIMIYPCMFLPRPKLRWRVLTAIALAACFVAVVEWSQSFDRIPTLQLDGSGARTYVGYLLANQDAGLLRSFLEHGLGEPPWSAPRLVIYGAALVLLGTFGYWSVVAIATVLWVRKRVPAAVWSFPLFIMANYLIMSLGLAMDSKQIGSPDELVNRPLVWAYFAVVAWTGGAIYYRFFGEGLPRLTAARAVLGLGAVLGLVVPLVFATNLQTFPHWPAFSSFRAAGAVPTCIVDAARFIRQHSAPRDVVQDSENDSRVWVTALSERPDFAMYAPNRPPAGLEERLADLAAFKRLTNAADIKAYAVRNQIAWYLLRPTSEVAWPAALRDHAAFECGGYRVLHFAP
jgi:hypothetical protein